MTNGGDEMAAAIAGVFSRAASTYDTVVPFFTRFGQRLVDLADLRPGQRVLDLGCGRGATLFPAAAAVGPEGSVLGTDLADEMVALLAADIERRGVVNASVRQLDAHALDLEDESFDVVLSGFLLHLLPRPEQAAAEIWRVLRPGGRCVASSPRTSAGEWDFLGRLFRTYGPRATSPVLMPFRPDFDLAATLAAAGFRVMDTVDETGEFRFAGGDQWWEWAWTHGMRGLFEALPAGALAELRESIVAELDQRTTADGLVLAQPAQFVIAERP
jgi:ubiquinone/menaquinone biosynthesis C-methylase UbiE